MSGAGPDDPAGATRVAAAALLRAAARGEPCAAPYLVVQEGPGPSRKVEVPGELTVGRSAAAALRLSDAGVSRLHARFRVGPDGEATVEDLGSKNGVRRNGRPVVGGPSPLHPGDAVVVGTTTLVYADPLAGPPAVVEAAPLVAAPVEPAGGAPAPAPDERPPGAGGAARPDGPGAADAPTTPGWGRPPPAALLAAGAALLALAGALLAAAG